MSTSSVRVLVVDDFAPIRQILRSKLQDDPKLQVVCEVSDGLEAVKKAEELQPELILLDISLPKLNGLEAARRIRKVSPSSKIVIVSQESSTGVIEEALRIGAKGYIVKTDIARELLPGVAVVLRGQIFISSHMGHSNKTIGEVVHRVTRINPHVAAVYRDDAALVDGLYLCIEHALHTGSSVIAVLTKLHRATLLQRLRAYGDEVDNDIRRGQLVLVDVAEACVTFAMDDQPDPKRFTAVRNLIDKAAAQSRAEYPKVFVCGECPSILLAEGHVDEAIKLEQLWNGISTIRGDIAVQCAYLSDHFGSKDSAHVFESICAEHSAVLGY
jgi:CheY-like chemotaxis protein